MTASIATVHVTNDDRIVADGRCVVIADTHGHTLQIACDDALVAFRFWSCFGKVREDMAVTKAERLDRLVSIERDAAGTDPAPAWVGGTPQADNGAAA